MIIVTSNLYIFNFAYITRIVISSNGVIKAHFYKNYPEDLGCYSNYEYASIAMKLLVEAMQKGNAVFTMPTEKEIQEYITKEHGGS